jgi:hypothetical protein
MARGALQRESSPRSAAARWLWVESSKRKTRQATEASTAKAPRSRSRLISEQRFRKSWAVLDLNQ